MIKNQFVEGLGSWAAPNLDMGVARNLIYSASKSYLGSFSSQPGGYELIQGLLALPSNSTVSCRAEEILNQTRETLRTLSIPVDGKNAAAAALLFIIHFELLKVFEDNTVLGQRELMKLSHIMDLQNEDIWDVAFSIASFADSAVESDNYTYTLDTLYSKFSRDNHIGGSDEN